MFSRLAEDILRRVGWSPSRKVDIVKWTEPLAAEGYAAHRLAASLLSNLGGLEIHPPHADRISFDPTIALGEFDRVKEWQDACQAILFPIGHVLSHYILLVDESGRVYVGFDEGLFHMGETIDEGLCRLYFENGGTPVPCRRPDANRK